MAEENAQEELDLEVEVSEPTDEVESANVEVVDDDQFKKAESSTQKRIDRLTKKMRTAERENTITNSKKWYLIYSCEFDSCYFSISSSFTEPTRY